MTKSKVAIVDSGGANIASLCNALDRLSATHVVTSDATTIRRASHVIIPGVGSADDAMQRLRESRLTGVIPSLSQPVLGICLGMQLIARSSEESGTACLSIVPGRVERLRASAQSPVPNMGWCRVRHLRSHALLFGIADGSYFYFAHSFALRTGEHTLATADHQAPFTAVLERDNFLGTQFHPERSAKPGARLLDNFLGLSS